MLLPQMEMVKMIFYTHFAAIYDDVNFTVFNRWGKIVYESTNYKNNWNGTNLNDLLFLKVAISFLFLLIMEKKIKV